MYKGDLTELYRHYVDFIFTDPIYADHKIIVSEIFEDLASIKRRTLRVLISELEKSYDSVTIKQIISTLLDDMILFTDKEQTINERTAIKVESSESKRTHYRVIHQADKIITLNYEELIKLDKKITIPKNFRNHVFIRFNMINKFGSFRSDFNFETFMADIISYQILGENQVNKIRKIVYSIRDEVTEEDTLQNLVTIRKIMENELKVCTYLPPSNYNINRKQA